MNMRSPGQPLAPDTRAFMESRFAHDFSQVRVHTDAKAAESAQAVNALAYTVGRDIAFGSGAFQPKTTQGLHLLAHELTHTIQQRATGNAQLAASMANSIMPSNQKAETEAERVAADVVTGKPVGSIVPNPSCPSLQRQAHGTPQPVSVRSPVFEETVTQLSTGIAAISGRPLTLKEIALAREIFRASIDYSRVRLIPTDILEYRTVGNTIRVPRDFTIANAYMAQTLIHDLTHVWQYQHGGTSYISLALSSQITATIRTGSRNSAYDYQLAPQISFFDLLPEQQGLLVENYFSMLRDRNAPQDQRIYQSNHMDASGNFQRLSWTARQAEITRELPLHQPLIDQMRRALPRTEADILQLRAMDVMRTPNQDIIPVPEERQIAPIRPLLEVRF